METINLQDLFDLQETFDARIVEGKGLEDHNLLDEKLLAFRTELGELANEIPTFKFWSDNKMPAAYKNAVKYAKLYKAKVIYPTTDAALEEYVDGLHFLLSIGLTLNIYRETEFKPLYVNQENELFNITKQINAVYDAFSSPYHELMGYFLGLGKAFGDWDRIKTAYLAKNKINHERQSAGY